MVCLYGTGQLDSAVGDINHPEHWWYLTTEHPSTVVAVRWDACTEPKGYLLQAVRLLSVCLSGVAWRDYNLHFSMQHFSLEEAWDGFEPWGCIITKKVLVSLQCWSQGLIWSLTSTVRAFPSLSFSVQGCWLVEPDNSCVHSITDCPGSLCQLRWY